MHFSRRKGILGFALAGTVAFGLQCKSVSPEETENSESQGIFDFKKDKILLPADYESRSAKEKSDILYMLFQETEFSKLPALKSVNPLKFLFSYLTVKMDRVSDEAPADYEKTIHAHGAVAKVQFEALPNPYSGLFQGADYGIIRLSVTSDPKGKDFAPGLALKLLVDGKASQNVSALYKLSGQQSDHNFFANELSNIIPTQVDPKSLFSMGNFGRVTRHPTKMSVAPFAAIDAKGQAIENPSAPAQIYFVPRKELAAKSEAHDFRHDLLDIPTDTVLYDVFATAETGTNFQKIDEERRAQAVKIGHLITRSPFIASDFGDRRLFFRHYRYEDFK